MSITVSKAINGISINGKEKTMEPKGNFVASVKLLVGQRGVSKLMASLDLGITKVGHEKIMEMTFKPGEKVDEERVRKAMDTVIAQMSKEQTSIEIISYEIVEVVFASGEGKET